MDKNLSPIHPGEILLEDFMKPLGLTQYRLAQDLGVTPIRISKIINGERPISSESIQVWQKASARSFVEEAFPTERDSRQIKIVAICICRINGCQSPHGAGLGARKAQAKRSRRGFTENCRTTA